MQPTFANSEKSFISARLYQSHQLPPQEFEQSLNSAKFPSNGKFFPLLEVQKNTECTHNSLKRRKWEKLNDRAAKTKVAIVCYEWLPGLCQIQKCRIGFHLINECAFELNLGWQHTEFTKQQLNGNSAKFNHYVICLISILCYIP